MSHSQIRDWFSTATFEAPPMGYMETTQLLFALHDSAIGLSDEKLIAHFKHICFNWSWQSQALPILKDEKLIDNWGLITNAELISVSFVASAEFDSSPLLEAIEAILEEHVYGFEVIPESFWTFWADRDTARSRL